MTNGETSKSVEKALDLLELFLTHDELMLGELADLAGLQKSVARRLAATLVKRGYLVQREKRGKYSLSTAYLSFSGVVKRRFRLRSAGMPYFLSLSRQVHETVTVAYVSDLTRLDEVATETFHDTSEDSAVFAVGPLPETAGMPLWCTCMGKAILAKLPEAMLGEYIARATLVPYSPKTITDRGQLRRSIEAIRREGIAFDEGEYMEGLRGVASGIDDGKGGVVGSVGVIGPELYLTTERVEAIAPAIKSCALAVTQVTTADGSSRYASAGRFALRELGPPHHRG
jgi:DNA-binding IclR family transcriptional regulator